MSDPESRSKVVICGAGPVGALAALYAAKRGLQVEVYDLRDDPRKSSSNPLNFTKSINLALSERGINAIQHTRAQGLLDTVFATAIPMHARMIHGKSESGQLFEESQKYDTNGRFIRAVDRAGLNKDLLDAAESMSNVEFHFNHKLTGADFERKKAWFEHRKARGEDGGNRRSEAGGRPLETEISYDFFLGADGAHSATRFHLMKFARVSYQQDYIDTLWCEFSIKANREGDFKISSNHLHIWPAGSFMFIAIPSTDRSFTCTLFASAADFATLSEDPESTLPAYFDAHFPGVCPDLISYADIQDQFKHSPKLPLISLKCSPYHFRSSVVILGDAAHAMVPFYGQGMNAGLEDVRVLFELLDEHDVFDSSAKPDVRASRREEALLAYTSQRTPDAHTINDLAMGNYREMSSNVISPVYKARKWLEETVSVYAPWLGWRTQYTRVSFENQRYSQVAKEVRRQGQMLMLGIAVAPLGIGALAFVTWRFRSHR